MEDNLKYLNVADLIPYENNPRNNDGAVDYVAKSIKEFGFKVPIVVDKNYIVVAGHTRLKASKKLGLEKVPVIIADDLSDEKIKAFRVADNKVAEIAVWKEEELHQELTELEGMLFDMTEFGFDSIGDLIEEEVEEDDFDEELPEEPISKRGDIWQLGRHRLMCGDSTNKSDVKKLMGGKEADIVFTDPPYNALTSWNKTEAKSETRLDPSEWFENDAMTWEEFDVFLTKAFANFSGHSVYVCCDFRMYHRVLSALETTDYKLKHCIVWKKNMFGLGKRYRFQHEFIVYACKDKAPFYGGHDQSDVWEEKVDRTTEHNTPKPVGLPAKAIRNSTKENELVMELFGGSGSTLIACEQTGRTCYAMELAERYCDLIITRWEELTGLEAELVEE